MASANVPVIGSDVLDARTQQIQGTSTSYPPYNIRKTGDVTYALDLDMTGYSKGDITSHVEYDRLVIEAKSNKKFSSNSSDTYFHQGITAGENLNISFPLATGMAVENANYNDGILIFNFKYTPPSTPAAAVPIGPEETVSEPPIYPVSYIPLYGANGDIVGKVNTVSGDQTILSSDTSLPPLANSSLVSIAYKPPSTEPVRVNLLDPMPQIVEVVPVEGAKVINLGNATNEVKSDDVDSYVIKKDNKDMVLAIPKTIPGVRSTVVNAVQVALDKVNVGLPQPTVPKATGISEIYLPKPLTIKIPDTISQIVEVDSDATGTLRLSSRADIPSDYTVVPVVTAPGKPDVVVVASPDTMKKIDPKKVDLSRDVSDALKTANPTIVKAKNEIISA